MRNVFAFTFGRAVAVLALLVAISASALAADLPPLVGPDWLKEHLKDDNLVVLDIRSAIDGGGVEAYEKAHIPGSVHSDYDKAGWRVTRNNIPFMVPSKAELEKLIGDIGIDEDSAVVVVPAGVNVLDFGSAARTLWTLKYAGVKNVAIFDGGVAAWQAADLPVETGASKPSPKIFTATIDKSILAEAPDVEKLSTSGGALVDARPATFFTAREKAPASQAYGHIPGARSVDSAVFYDSRTNRLKPKAELEEIARTMVPDGPAVSYCNTGHWAATDWFVLHDVLGRTQTRLYAGSMVEWTSDARRPIASSRTKWDDLKKALGLGL